MAHHRANLSPTAVSQFVALGLGALEHEVFAVLLMGALNCLIEYSKSSVARRRRRPFGAVSYIVSASRP